MPILSLEFICFFLFLFPIYWIFYKSPKVQNIIIIISSIILLGYLDYRFAFVVIGFCGGIYAIAQLILSTNKPKIRKFCLYSGIILIILNLSLFKYYDFFRPLLENIIGKELTTLFVPLGLSYYSFQAISYLVFVFKYNQPLTGRNLLLYLSFFPTITAGPIIRPDATKSIYGTTIGAVSQIETSSERVIIRPALALSLIILGIAKKWSISGIIANNLVNPIFDNPAQYNFFTILAAIYGYTFQLFMDFSGYTDIVIGLSMLLGYQLPNNFNQPLSAYNIRDFWNRWHITLSTWIRDFIYIPLGGNKFGYFRTQINVFIAMVLSGIWHGSGFNFVLWGALHGSAIIGLNTIDKLFGKKNLLAQSKLGKLLAIFITFNFVSFTFVIFHNANFGIILSIFKSLLNFKADGINIYYSLLIISIMLTYIFMNKWLTQLFNSCVTLIENSSLVISIVYFFVIINFITILAPSGIPSFIYANF